MNHPCSFGVPNAPYFIKKRKTLHRKAFRKKRRLCFGKKSEAWAVLNFVKIYLDI